MFLEAFFSELDRRCFLGIPIWHFSYRSFFRRYGQVFLWRIALRNPIGFAKALRRAREIWAFGPKGWVWDTCGPSVTPDLVAAGFCMKPECPAGRFTHRCMIAETGGRGALESSCVECAMPPLLALARQHGAAFYIMTSGYDIARQLFIPNVRYGLWRRGLFFLCPYSARPFLLAALASGFEARLVTFCDGACGNFEDFLKADRGEKPEVTRIDPTLWQPLVKHNWSADEMAFTFENGVYWPLVSTDG